MTYERAVITAPEPVKLTVREFLLLADSGALDRYSKTELIHGEVVGVNAQFTRHMKVKNRLYRRLADACDRLGTGLEAWSEGTIDMSPDDAPEPDLFVTRELPDVRVVPLSALVLVGEVADASIRFDMNVKAPMYASKGVAEYWVIDVDRRVIHQFWHPGADCYEQSRQIAFGERLSSATIGGLVVETDGL